MSQSGLTLFVTDGKRQLHGTDWTGVTALLTRVLPAAVAAAIRLTAVRVSHHQCGTAHTVTCEISMDNAHPTPPLRQLNASLVQEADSSPQAALLQTPRSNLLQHCKSSVQRLLGVPYGLLRSYSQHAGQHRQEDWIWAGARTRMHVRICAPHSISEHAHESESESASELSSESASELPSESTSDPIASTESSISMSAFPA